MMTTLYPSVALKVQRFVSVSSLLLAGTSLIAGGIPELKWKSHDRSRPAPAVVTPGAVSSGNQVGSAPSDAVVLFDGSDLNAWVDQAGNPTKWIISEGALECVPQSGYIRSLQSFGDCQLHVEWATPVSPEGESQGRGNSGVFFGMGQYEVQVLDSYQNLTYSDGSASSVYGQYPPLVNVSKGPGEWQTYDIIYTAPRFEACGALKSPARLTVFHNGVLTQNDVTLTGPTAWIGRPAYKAHPEKMPIALQDHGNPVRYRNIWVRELGPKDKAEYMLSEDLLKSYEGSYKKGWGDMVEIHSIGNGQLELKMAGATEVMYAESETRFFSKTTDVIADFSVLESEGAMQVWVGGDGPMVMERE